MTMIYAHDGSGDVHLIPVTQGGTLCGKERTDLHGTGGPVTCRDCLLAARSAFAWVLMHYSDDAQARVGNSRGWVIPLGHIDQRGRRIVTPREAQVRSRQDGGER
jgi:hypothetical protein